MSTAKDMVEGMAFELWAQALAGYCHDHPNDHRRRDEYEDLTRGAGEPPDEAMKPAMELANLYEIATGMTLPMLLEYVRRNKWGDLDDEWLSDPYEVGHLLASMAINHVENWPYESNLPPVHFEVSFDGRELVWSGDIPAAPQLNPADPSDAEIRALLNELIDEQSTGNLWDGTMERREWRADKIAMCEDALRGDRSARRECGELMRSRATVNPARRGVPGGGARGPTRVGEKSQFRSTFKGHQRSTAVIPRARFTTSETGKQQFTLSEMLSANADSPHICQQIRELTVGATAYVDIGGGQVRVKRVA